MPSSDHSVSPVLAATAATAACSACSASASTTATTAAAVVFDDLPDDLILRVLHHVGDLSRQIGAAYRLSSLSVRLRRLVHQHFLPSLTQLHVQSLSSLSLSQPSRARAALVSFFSHTTNIRLLNLAGCSRTLLSRPSLSALSVASSHELRSVNLAHCCISDEVLSPLLTCPRLNTLILISCDGPTGLSFAPSICSAPLTHLDLSWVQSLTFEGILAVGQLSNLHVLHFTGCESLHSSVLHSFASTPVCRSLRSISLSYCPVHDNSLATLLRNAPLLTHVALAEFTANLWFTGDFTQSAIDHLAKDFPKVSFRFLT